MNGGTERGFSTISLGRLQYVRRDSAGPTEKKKQKEAKVGIRLLCHLRRRKRRRRRIRRR
jgi:hypothetical protein